MARIADRGYRRVVIAGSIAMWSLCLGLTGTVHSFFQLALTRFGIGIGEAGFGPAANSLLGYYFDAPRMARAAAIFGAGAALGIFAAYAVGGWLLAVTGWRYGLMLAGLPGIALGLLAFITLREPPRSAIANAYSGFSALQVLRELFRRRSLVWMMAGATLLTFCDASIFFWFPSFMMRVHKLDVANLGLSLGTAIGLGQMAGLLASGFLSSRLLLWDMRWSAWLPALCSIAAAPIAAFAYLTGSPAAASALIALPIALSSTYWSPMIVCLQRAAPEGMKAVFIAVLYLLISGLGYGVGPAVVGFVSDRFHGMAGDASIRIGLLVNVPIYIAAALCFMAGARNLRQDLPAHDG